MKYAFVLLLLAGCTAMPPKKSCEFKSVGSADGVEYDDVACVMNTSVAPKARLCYEDILTANDKLEFRVVQTFEISQSGLAENISYDSDIATSSFGVCMTRAIKEASYPAHTSTKPVVMHYPWRFKRSNR